MALILDKQELEHGLASRVLILFVLFIVVNGALTPAQAITPDSRESSYVSSETSLDVTKAAGSAPNELPPWPLDLMGKEERFPRLSFFLKQYSFKVKEEGTNNRAICEPLLNQLKVIDSTHVLQRADTGVPNIQCENIRDMTQYEFFDGKQIPSLRPDDKEFASLSIEEKENKADFFYRQADRQFTEYYDLSKYFGPDSGAILGDAVAVNYNSRHVQAKYLRGWDAYIESGVLGRVFNVKSCSAYFLPLLKGVQRMKGTGDFHETTPSFAALVEIDNKPYALKFRFSESWNDFYRLLNVRGFPPQITLIPLLDPDDVKDDISIKSSCLYEALPKQIKY